MRYGERFRVAPGSKIKLFLERAINQRGAAESCFGLRVQIPLIPRWILRSELRESDRMLEVRTSRERLRFQSLQAPPLRLLQLLLQLFEPWRVAAERLLLAFALVSPA